MLRFLIYACLVIVMALLSADCENGATEPKSDGPAGWFTFRFGPSTVGGPTYYYYVPWDHISEFTLIDEESGCGLYGYDLLLWRVRRQVAGDSLTTTDTADQPDPDTYVQYTALANGQICGLAPMADGKFWYSDVKFILSGVPLKAFPGAANIQPAADPETDVYWRGDWSIAGNDTTTGSLDFWPYLYDTGHPPPGRAAANVAEVSSSHHE